MARAGIIFYFYRRFVVDELIKDEGGEAEYTMPEDCERVWITVRNLSIRIKQGTQGINVDVYPLRHEDADPVGGMYTFYSDVEDIDESKLEEEDLDDDTIRCPACHKITYIELDNDKCDYCGAWICPGCHILLDDDNVVYESLRSKKYDWNIIRCGSCGTDVVDEGPRGY
jgi:uncharacterized CHY-type Zn-finger protein